jgi:tungstate transport system ATP-binding protein
MVSPILPLRASGLEVRRRGRPLLGPLDLAITEPGIAIVVGPNGGGKTTLLKALHGLERRSAGTVTWGLPAAEAAARQAFVFQTPIMLRRTVRENLTYPLKIACLPGPERGRRVADWADRAGLVPLLDRPATRLSGGERQKLALARALIAAPDFLFLDEPCTNLDGRATREIEELLQAEAARGTAVLMATHDIGQARRLADRVLFLHRGRILEEGPAAEVLSAPTTAALASFVKGDIVE